MALFSVNASAVFINLAKFLRFFQRRKTRICRAYPRAADTCLSSRSVIMHSDVFCLFVFWHAALFCRRRSTYGHGSHVRACAVFCAAGTSFSWCFLRIWFLFWSQSLILYWTKKHPSSIVFSRFSAFFKKNFFTISGRKTGFPQRDVDNVDNLLSSDIFCDYIHILWKTCG